MSGPRGEAVSLFVARGRTAGWALPAARVKRVALAREWEGGAPFDVALALGLEAGDAARVLTVPLDGSTLALWAPAGAAVEELAAAEVLALPAALLGPLAGTAIRAVAVREGQPPLYVLDPEGLAALATSNGRTP